MQANRGARDGSSGSVEDRRVGERRQGNGDLFDRIDGKRRAIEIERRSLMRRAGERPERRTLATDRRLLP